MFDIGAVDSNLLIAIISMCTVLLKRAEASITAAEDTLCTLAKLNPLDEQPAENIPTLWEFQLGCLLAYYTFHQSPGQESWLRIGKLSRKAYQCGLHQIDNPDQDSPVLSTCTDQNEIEAWRRVWWFIFCMDSYSNITAATPFILERESIRTALPRSNAVYGQTEAEAEPALYLDDPDMLWKTVKEITNRNTMVNESLHIVTTAILNEAAHLQRLVNQNPSTKLRHRLLSLEAHLSAIRLALPPRYLDPARNVLLGESSSDYHARLICVLHLHAARILSFLPFHVFESKEGYSRWQRTMEYCEDVVTIIKEWDSLYSLSVDPAVCFIGYTALTILLLHSKSVNRTNIEMMTKLEADQGILVLFLEQFASLWELPKHLKCMCLKV